MAQIGRLDSGPNVFSLVCGGIAGSRFILIADRLLHERSDAAWILLLSDVATRESAYRPAARDSVLPTHVMSGAFFG